MAKDPTKKKSKKAAAASAAQESAPEPSTSAQAAAAAPAATAPSDDARPSKKAKKDGKGKKASKKAAVDGEKAEDKQEEAEVEDKELDGLFKTAATFRLPTPEPAPIPIRVPSANLPSERGPPPREATSKAAKRKRSEPTPAAAVSKPVKGGVENDDELSELEDDDEDDDEDLEEAYERKLAALGDDDDDEADASAPAASASQAKPTIEDLMDVDGVDASGPDALVHETVLASRKQQPAEKKLSKTQLKKQSKLPTWAPADETAEQVDARTLFVGNLSVELATNKKLLHQLHAHLLTALPSLAKIESTRFRSAAFATPTEDLPGETAEADAARAANRARERTKAWREKEALKTQGEEGKLDEGKSFMTPEEKKRVAFIKKDFHAAADFTNAYVVFAHAHPDRSTNVAPLMDPYEAARLCAQRVNGTVFNGRTIRVDLVRANASSAPTARAKSQLWVAGTDPKRSVFVGNVGLDEKEESLRAFFEELLTKERGDVPAAVEGEEYAGDRWVVNVRIIRDKGTGLGKGFAYIATRDRDCVDELLALPEEKLKYNKRKLRVQRCKTLPSKPKTTPADAAAAAAAADKPDVAKKGAASSTAGAPLPKGNPLLGEQIKDLSKDERKVAKAADADRLARRMAKKKARVAMDKQGGAGAADKTAGKRESVKLGAFGGRNAKSKTDLKAKKSRTRSEHAAAGRNKKKA